MKIIDNIKSLISRFTAFCLYCWKGVWRDPSTSMRVRIIKTINLCINTFLDKDLQKQAAALVYSTLLAIVPALALLFAIGRGFGFQTLISNELLRFFPAQEKVINTATNFVDSYLTQASQGLFVGIGIVFLLWTLISLLSNIENVFNSLWGIKSNRTFYRKITDYTALCLLVPILMVCSAGINIFMATFMKTIFGHTLLSPVVSILLDCAPFVLYCVAFTISFLIVPNTNVQLKYAAISGLICGIAFQLVQTLFISGQLYVAKYNAIYGSFSFLPLLLIWLHLSWLILLFGCTLTYSLQNIFHFTFTEDTDNIAPGYMRKLTVATAAIIVTRFKRSQPPCTLEYISRHHGLPIRLITGIVHTLHAAGVIYYVELTGGKRGLAPAVELSTYTLADLLRSIEAQGNADFVPGFTTRYHSVVRVIDKLNDIDLNAASTTLLASIEAE